MSGSLPFSIRQKAHGVSWHNETVSTTRMQRRYSSEYNRHSPGRLTVLRWPEILRPKISGESSSVWEAQIVESARTKRGYLLQQKPKKVSAYSGGSSNYSTEFNTNIYQKQSTHASIRDSNCSTTGRPRQCSPDLVFEFFQQKTLSYCSFLNLIIFSDESVFHLNGKVRKDVRIYGTENPHGYQEEF